MGRMTLPFMMVVVLIGILYMELLIILVGLALAVFVWLTTPRRYEIFRDRLVIGYGMPRRSAFPLADVMTTDVVSMPLGGTRLVIRRHKGRPLILSPDDPEEFKQQLDWALGTPG